MTLPDEGESGSGDIVQFGRSPRRRPRWLGPVLLACLAAAAVVAVVAHSSGPRPAHVSPPLPSLPPTPVTAPVATNVGHPILGIRARWELFGMNGSGVVAVQFAKGRIVRSAFPPILSSAQVWFVVAKGAVIVRPLDNVPGYLVPDGKPARPLTGVLAEGGILLPGPSLSQEWFDRFDPATVLLIGPGGKPTGVALATPSAPDSLFFAMADGRGDVVLDDNGGTMYDAGPGLLRPIGTPLIAVGPTKWLALQCSSGACHDVVIDPATGVSKPLPGRPITLAPAIPPLGLVAPDGATAAVVVSGSQDGIGTLDLIDLGTGAETRLDVPVGNPSYQQLAWSPDGAWLFAITARGTLTAISIRTGRAENLGLGVSGLSQIAIRPASG